MAKLFKYTLIALMIYFAYHTIKDTTTIIERTSANLKGAYHEVL